MIIENGIGLFNNDSGKQNKIEKEISINTEGKIIYILEFSINPTNQSNLRAG